MPKYNTFLSRAEMLDWDVSSVGTNPAREGIFVESVEATSAALAVNKVQEKIGHNLDGVWHAWETSADTSSTSEP